MKKSTRAILLVGTAETCPNLRYVSGFRAVDPVTFLAKDAQHQYLLVPQLEHGRAEKESTSKRHVRVLTPDDLSMTKAARKRLNGWVLALLKTTGVKSVTVPASFPLGVARRLERAGVRVAVIKGDLFPERAIKTSAEVRQIRESQQAAVIAMRSAMAMMRSATIEKSGQLRYNGKTLTSEMVKGIIARVLLEHDCIGKDTIVAGGVQAADPHDTGMGPLKAHEAIVIDIFPQHIEHGYWGDITRTFVRGAAPAKLKRMYRAVRAAQAAALNKVKSGVKCVTVHRAAVKEMVARGFRTEVVNGRCVGFIHSTGHGVGLAIHEEPAVGMGETRLKNGNVITIEPGLYYPDIGGIRVEDTVVVAPGGWRYLVPCEKPLELL